MHEMQEHLQDCKYTVVTCPNVGCGETLRKAGMEGHLSCCKFTPVLCEWCQEKLPLHNKEVFDTKIHA